LLKYVGKTTFVPDFRHKSRDYLHKITTELSEILRAYLNDLSDLCGKVLLLFFHHSHHSFQKMRVV
jgi:hypothetical protein